MKTQAILIIKLVEHIEQMTPVRMIVKRWVREAKSSAEQILTAESKALTNRVGNQWREDLEHLAQLEQESKPETAGMGKLHLDGYPDYRENNDKS